MTSVLEPSLIRLLSMSFQFDGKIAGQLIVALVAGNCTVVNTAISVFVSASSTSIAVQRSSDSDSSGGDAHSNEKEDKQKQKKTKRKKPSHHSLTSMFKSAPFLPMK